RGAFLDGLLYDSAASGLRTRRGQLVSGTTTVAGQWLSDGRGLAGLRVGPSDLWAAHRLGGLDECFFHQRGQHGADYGGVAGLGRGSSCAGHPFRPAACSGTIAWHDFAALGSQPAFLDLELFGGWVFSIPVLLLDALLLRSDPAHGQNR